MDAHHIVHGIGPAGAPAAEQIVHALVVQLAARFQRYCRELHDAAVDALASAVPQAYRRLLTELLLSGRRLDRQNAMSAALEHDFLRFELRLWRSIAGVPASTRSTLDQVNAARNAIAHQDVRRLDRLRLDLDTVRNWHRVLDELAGAMDQTIGDRVQEITGISPWKSRPLGGLFS